MKDIQRGDKVQLYNGKTGLVILVANNSVYVTLDTITSPLEIIRANESIDFRYPRPLEEIQVASDCYLNWYNRTFICMDEDGAVCIADRLVPDETTIWTYWRLIPKEKTKEEKIQETIEKIKNDDPDTIKELAEIILERLNLDEKRY